jgi:hypothetical protein
MRIFYLSHIETKNKTAKARLFFDVTKIAGIYELQATQKHQKHHRAVLALLVFIVM